MIKKVSFLLFFVMVSGFCSGKGLTEKQTALFEIAGVKIGMTEDQTMEALVNKYHVPKDKIKTQKSFIKGLTGQRETGHLYLQTDNKEDIYVYFDVDATASPYKVVVSSVSYEIPNTSENTKALYESAVKKYGKYSFVSSVPADFIWCQLKGKLSLTDNCKEGTTILSVGRSSSKISIKNNKYEKARRKLEQSKQNRTPNF